MGIRSWLWRLMDPRGGKIETTQELCQEARVSLYYRQLAFWACVQIVASAVSKVRWRTFVQGEEVAQDDHYYLNLRPNRNQNSSEFYRSLVGKLFAENEVLVIIDPIEGQWLIADSFSKEKRAIYDYTFEGVTVNGFEFEKTFYQSEVFYFELNNENVKRLLDSAYAEHAKLMESAARSYRMNRGRKGIVHIDTMRGGTPEAQQAEIDLMNRNLSRLFEAENGFTVLEKGKTYQDLSQQVYASDTTRDIKALIDDVYEMYARAFGVPPVMLKGQVAGMEDAVDYFVKFAVEPIVDMIATEFTTKLYGRRGYLAGSRVRADTSRIQQMTLKELGSHADKLVGSGLYSVNEIREKMDEPKIDEDWAERHWVTLNYERAERAKEEYETEEV